MWQGGEENSRLVVEDCRLPELRRVSFATRYEGSKGQLAAVVSYIDGSERDGPDRFSVKLNGSETSI